MGGRKTATQRQAQRRRKLGQVAEINARTACAHCGGQPIEWHNPTHAGGREKMRIATMVHNCRSLAAILVEMAAPTPLCRPCHMREDGRSAALTAARPLKLGHTSPDKPCQATGCESFAKYLRKGLCHRCYERRREAACRTATNRPS